MDQEQPKQLVTITLARPIAFDTINVVTGGRAQFKASALTGRWILKSSGEHFCFAAIRAFTGDGSLPIEIGTLKSEDKEFLGAVAGKGYWEKVYADANREPIAVETPDSNVVGEVPAVERN